MIDVKEVASIVATNNNVVVEVQPAPDVVFEAVTPLNNGMYDFYGNYIVRVVSMCEDSHLAALGMEAGDYALCTLISGDQVPLDRTEGDVLLHKVVPEQQINFFTKTMPTFETLEDFNPGRDRLLIRSREEIMDTSQYENTQKDGFVEEFDVVCGNEYYPAGTIVGIGYMIGNEILPAGVMATGEEVRCCYQHDVLYKR